MVSGGTSEPLVEDGHMFDMEEDDLLEQTETGAKTPLLDNSGEALSSPMGTPLCIASEALEVSKEVQIEESQRETATATVLDQLHTPPLGPLLDKALEKASQGAAAGTSIYTAEKEQLDSSNSGRGFGGEGREIGGQKEPRANKWYTLSKLCFDVF